MDGQKKSNRFLLKHAKSSAMVVSLIVHAILIVGAASFVAVKVYQNMGAQFDAPRVVRPSAPIKRLQVPVKMKKQHPKPKQSKRIVVKTRMNQKMPKIQMPEIRGIKTGLGASPGTGLGGAASVGFSMPEINVFGVKSRGEKVFLVLDASPDIMRDEIGGIRAYAIIKAELIRILRTLPSTTLFNMAVYDRRGNKTVLAFSTMRPASQENIDTVEKWITPLNSVKPHMGQDEYGIKTLGEGGIPLTNPPLLPEGKGNIRGAVLWSGALFEAMKEQADAVFLLTSDWGRWIQCYNTGKTPKWSDSARKKWEEAYQKGLKLLEEDNRKRAERGDPPRAIEKENPWAVNGAYFPGIEQPPTPERHFYTPREFMTDFVAVRRKYQPSSKKTKLGLRGKKKGGGFSVNVILFVPKDGSGKESDENVRAEIAANFKSLSSLSGGEFREIKGEKGIKSAVATASEPSK